MNDYELELKELIEAGHVTNSSDLSARYDNNLSEEFINKYFDFLYIKDIICYQNISEQFLEAHIEKFDKNALIAISSKISISESFIRKFQNKIYWNCIFYSNKSESFLEEFQDKVSWFKVSINCKLSEGFIRKFQNKINFSNLNFNKTKLSQKFILEFKDKINFYRFPLCYFPKIKRDIFWKTFL